MKNNLANEAELLCDLVSNRHAKNLLSRLGHPAGSKTILAAINGRLSTAKAFSITRFGDVNFALYPRGKQTIATKIVKLLRWNTGDVLMVAASMTTIKFSCGEQGLAKNLVHAGVEILNSSDQSPSPSAHLLQLVHDSGARSPACEVAMMFHLCEAVRCAGMKLERFLGELKRLVIAHFVNVPGHSSHSKELRGWK